MKLLSTRQDSCITAGLVLLLASMLVQSVLRLPARWREVKRRVTASG